MVALNLGLAGRPARAWWLAPGYQIADESGGTLRPPALIASFREDRHAVTAHAAGTIAAATTASLADLAPTSFAGLFSFTRSSGASFVDANGTLRNAASDGPRFDYTNGKRQLLLEGPATNTIRNNTCGGALVGIVGSGGALPTNWGSLDGIGLQREILATGTHKGVDHIDLRLSGSITSGAASITLAFETTTGIAALSGEAWSHSAFLSVIGGSSANIGAIRLSLSERDSGGAVVVTATGPDLKAGLDANLKRQGFPRTLAGGATTAFLQPRLTLEAITGAIDITLRIGLPQLEKMAFPTSVIRTTGAAATRAADNCQLGPKANAVLARAGVGLVVRGQATWGSLGRIVGGFGNTRLVGISGAQTGIFLGSTAVLQLGGAITVPLPAFGIAAGWDAGGKAGSFNGSTVASTPTPLDTNVSASWLGRDQSSGFGHGRLDELALYPFRPATAALALKAVPHG